jgi:chromosome partitioning protein
MKTIAISNHKGGTGKTALTHTLGYALASIYSRRVLLVDADPQASLTGACGVGVVDYSLADVLGGTDRGKHKIRDVILQVAANLDLVPADIALSPAELGLVTRLNREMILQKALSQVTSGYDVCLIDCPPSLSLLTINSLAASEGILIPTQPQPVDLRGLALYMQTLEAIKEDLNPALELIGIVATFYENRLITHREAIREMKKAGWPVLGTTIGRTVRISEAPAVGETIITFDPRNPRTGEFLEIAEVINNWLINKTR